MEKRFFKVYDDENDDEYYVVVARDADHAKSVLSAAGVELGDPSRPLDQVAKLVVKVISPKGRQVDYCDGRAHPVPLVYCDLGDFFSNYY